MIISATPIPGNEKLVSRTVDYLFRQGAEVIYEASCRHSCFRSWQSGRTETYAEPGSTEVFIPVHGEYRMLKVHAKLAQDLGSTLRPTYFITDNGSILEFTAETGAITGKVTAGAIMVDGLGVGDVATLFCGTGVNCRKMEFSSL